MATTLKPEPGDLIEIFRGAYQHWAVFIGDGYVVHLATPSEVTGAGSSSVMSVVAAWAMVKKEKLEDVVGTDDWKISNNLDDKYHQHPVADIVKEALQLVGRKMKYSLLKSNCEHFANLLRYGVAVSLQVEKAIKAAVAASATTAVVIGVGALIAWLGGSKKENEIEDSD